MPPGCSITTQMLPQNAAQIVKPARQRAVQTVCRDGNHLPICQMHIPFGGNTQCAVLLVMLGGVMPRLLS